MTATGIHILYDSAKIAVCHHKVKISCAKYLPVSLKKRR